MFACMAERVVECPNCGESIPRRALACPECGSDAETGWAGDEEISYQSVEIPEEWSAEEWSEDGRSTTPGWVRMTALVAAAALVFLIVRGLF